jgi:UrcA family protein
MEHNMSNFISKKRTLSLTLACAGLFTVSNLASAQQITEEVIVRAPAERITDVTPVGSPVRIESVEISQYVGITDLDLSKSADIGELDMRIEAVAKESCQKISAMYPFDRLDPMRMHSCVIRAVASAENQRETAITVGH